MLTTFDAEYVSLHVRVTNKVAVHLYTDCLGYRWGNCGQVAHQVCIGQCCVVCKKAVHG